MLALGALILGGLALLISTCSLLFLMWWTRWRKGKLHVGRPRAFAVSSRPDLLLLQIPVVFYNDGAVPIIVNDLKLAMGSGEQARTLGLAATVTRVGTDDGRAFATQFPVPARQAVFLILEFQRSPGGVSYEVYSFEATEYPVELYGKLDAHEEWTLLSRFHLRIEENILRSINSGILLAHSNLADD